jgi:hypothetical protein
LTRRTAPLYCGASGSTGENDDHKEKRVEDGRLYAGVHLASFEWLGEWSEPVHGGPAFRCGRAVIADENGRAHPLAFTAESDGSWSIR